MARRLNSQGQEFRRRFRGAAVCQARGRGRRGARRCAAIIADVRARGDAALVELTNKFDRANVTAADPENFRRRDRRRADQGDARSRKTAIEIAATRIEAYHRRQLPEGRKLHGRYRRHAGLALDRASTAPVFMSRAAPPAIRLRS